MFLNSKIKFVSSLFSIVGLLYLNNCGSSSSSSTSDDTDDTTDVAQVTVSGQVAVRAEDVAGSLSSPQLIKAAFKKIHPKFATIGDTVLVDAEVTLVQITADGTETEVATTTTDAEGNYTLEQVDVCQAGTGATDDYYYEMRVTSGETTVRSAICPTDESETVTADVSPETTIAADIIAEVADAPSQETNPVPQASEFVELTNLVANNIEDIEESIEIPALTDDEGIVDLANGMASAGGDAETSYKAYQFESEFTGLSNSDETTTEDLSGYIVRVAKEACDQPSTTPILEAAAEALAEAMDAGTTFTPTEVVEAFNDASGAPTAEVADVVTGYAELLDSIESVEEIVDVDALVKNVELIDESMVAAFTQHDLVAADLNESSELTADQALTMLMSIPDDPCSFTGGFDLTAAIAALTGDADLEEPVISEVEIYNDSGFGCNGLGQGHFVANVQVYFPEGSALSVTGVTVSSSDTTSLDGDGTVTLALNGNRYSTNAEGVCVTIGDEVTYTVTATLSDASTITKEVTRTHPSVPEADCSIEGGVQNAGEAGTPIVTPVVRPLITWEDPDDMLAEIPTAPEGSQIKYQYEFQHYRQDTDIQVNNASCPSIAFGAFYSVDKFLPTIDCDIEACATATGLTPDQIMCRVSIQTYLVDETDDILAKAAGDFKFFCVDSNDDDDCGE